MTDFGVRGPKNSALRPKTWGEVNFRHTKKSGPGGQECQFFFIFLQKTVIHTQIFNIYQFGDRDIPFLAKKLHLKLNVRISPVFAYVKIRCFLKYFKNPLGVQNEKYSFFPDWDDLISLLEILKTLRNAYFRSYFTRS